MSGKASHSDNQGGVPDRRRSEDRGRRAKTSIIAYYKTQRRGFRRRGELEEWLSSERAAESGMGAGSEGNETTRAKSQNDRDGKKQ